MKYVESVEVYPIRVTLQKGKWYHDAWTEVCPESADCREVEWYSDNTSVATVNASSGHIYAKGVGTAKIYAKAIDGSGKKDYCSVTVENTVYVSDIEVSESSLVLDKGKSFQLCATVCPSNASNKKVRWCSGDTRIATVDSSTGCVTARSAGKVAIYASSQDGSEVCDYCCVTVKQKATAPTEDKDETKTTERTFADPVDVFSGAHILKNTLMTLFGGQGLSLVAHYDSTKLSGGILGIGWYHNYEKHLENLGNEIRMYNSPSTYLTYTCNNDCTVYTCTAPNKNGYILTVDCCGQYPYILNCNSERTEFYNSDGFLAKVVDHQGFETLITYSGGLITITDTVSGKKIYLEKDNTGKLVRVYDDVLRQATLTYEGNLLTAICDINGNRLSYTYNEECQVLTGTDSKGICYFTNTYDEYGRVITQKDGISGSAVSTFSYEDNKRITTDRNGNQSVRVFDDDGLLVSYTDDNKIVLNSTVTVGVYIEPFDLINIHFHDLKSNHTLYWGAPE